MTGVPWTHRPAPPAALAARLDALAPGVRSDSGTPIAVTLVDAAAEVLGRLLSESCTSRDSALDLLAADSLVTYAFEAAACDPDGLEELADLAMRRLAAAVGA